MNLYVYFIECFEISNKKNSACFDTRYYILNITICLVIFDFILLFQNVEYIFLNLYSKPLTFSNR
jgi:hypothetical protein